MIDFRRNLIDIKKNQVRFINARIANELKKNPGLTVGIIGKYN